jgi:hypothetical protein
VCAVYADSPAVSSVIASEDMELDDLEDDADADEADEQDAEGEADDAEDVDADGDELEDAEEEPESAVVPGSKAGANGLRIKLKFGGGAKGAAAGAGVGTSKVHPSGSLGKRPARAAAKKAGKRAKRVAMEAELRESGVAHCAVHWMAPTRTIPSSPLSHLSLLSRPSLLSRSSLVPISGVLHSTSCERHASVSSMMTPSLHMTTAPHAPPLTPT